MRHVLALIVLGLSVACNGSPTAPRPSLAPSGSSSVSLHAFSGGSAVLSATDRYCFLATIDDVDKRGDVVGMVRGNGSIGDLIEGRDPETAGNETWFNRYVLKPSLLPAGSPEVRAFGGMGINTNVPNIIRREIDDLRLFWWSIEPGTNPLYTRAQLQVVMISNARNNNCTHYWQIVPGDVLTVAAAGQAGDLVSKFLPIP